MMMLVLFLFILISIIMLITCLSTIQLSIKDFKLDSNEWAAHPSDLQHWHIFQVNIKILFLNKIPILKIEMGKNQILKIIERIELKNKIISLATKDLTNERNIKVMQYIKSSRIKIKKFNLNIDMGTSDAVITSFLTAGIASGIGILLSTLIKKFDKKNYKYAVTPIYKNKNIIKIGLNCIISVKTVHIIYIIYMFFKKRRVDDNERTSNRRTYDYGYE